MESEAGSAPARSGPREGLFLEISSAAFPLLMTGAALDKVRARALENRSVRPSNEAGGVLYGRLRREPGSAPVVEICEVEMFEWGGGGPLEARSRRQRVEEICRRARPDQLAPVGFWRTADEGSLALDRRDVELAEHSFRGLYHAFVLVQRASGESVVGGVFVRANSGKLRASAPAVRFEAGPSKVAILPAPEGAAELRLGEDEAWRPYMPVHVPSSSGSVWRVLTICLLLLVAGGSIYVYLLRRGLTNSLQDYSEMQAAEEPESLRAELDGRDIRATWNRNAPLFRGAKEALLVIRDGTEEKRIPLDLRLESGVVLYTPRSDDVEFQVRTYGTTERTESIRVVGTGAPGAGAWASVSVPKALSPYQATDGAERHTAGERASATRKFVPPDIRPNPDRPAALPSAPEVAGVREPEGIPFGAADAPPPPSPFRPAEKPPVAAAKPQPAPAQPVAPQVTPAEPPSPAVPRHKVFPNIPSTYHPNKGAVVVWVGVDSTGKVTSARVMSSSVRDKLVQALVVGAAKNWEFVPAKVHGRPVPGQVEITFNVSPQ